MYIKNVISHKCYSALKLAAHPVFLARHVTEILDLASSQLVSPVCHVMLLTVSIGCRVPRMFVTVLDIWPSLKQ